MRVPCTVHGLCALGELYTPEWMVRSVFGRWRWRVGGTNVVTSYDSYEHHAHFHCPSCQSRSYRRAAAVRAGFGHDVAGDDNGTSGDASSTSSSSTPTKSLPLSWSALVEASLLVLNRVHPRHTPPEDSAIDLLDERFQLEVEDARNNISFSVNTRNEGPHAAGPHATKGTRSIKYPQPPNTGCPGAGEVPKRPAAAISPKLRRIFPFAKYDDCAKVLVVVVLLVGVEASCFISGFTMWWCSWWWSCWCSWCWWSCW